MPRRHAPTAAAKVFGFFSLPDFYCSERRTLEVDGLSGTPTDWPPQSPSPHGWSNRQPERGGVQPVPPAMLVGPMGNDMAAAVAAEGLGFRAPAVAAADAPRARLRLAPAAGSGERAPLVAPTPGVLPTAL